jgi:hypothetical protein
MIKNEHDFINQWIEYHLKIGFSHFYLVIDNVRYEQPEYNINESFKSNVTFIKVNNDTLKKYTFPGGIEHSVFIHLLLNYEVIDKGIIKEDWVTTIGLDQFIYLKDINITTFLESIDKECTQIIIPWSICAFNTKDLPYDNLMANVNQYLYEYNGTSGHSNGFIRTNNVKALCGSSHSFISKSFKQKIYIVDEYFTEDSTLDTWKIFGIAREKMKLNAFGDLKISSFHFIIRNLNELIVKSYFYWYDNKIQLDFLADNIKNKFVHDSLFKHRKLYDINNINLQECNLLRNLNTPNISCLNSNNNYDAIIFNKLKDYEITEEQYNEWKKILTLEYFD